VSDTRPSMHAARRRCRDRPAASYLPRRGQLRELPTARCTDREIVAKRSDYAASRINQLRKSSSAASHLLTIDEKTGHEKAVSRYRTSTGTESYRALWRSNAFATPAVQERARPGRSTTSRRSELLNVDLAISRLGREVGPHHHTYRPRIPASGKMRRPR
jgi:hypothetical protein